MYDPKRIIPQMRIYTLYTRRKETIHSISTSSARTQKSIGRTTLISQLARTAIWISHGKLTEVS